MNIAIIGASGAVGQELLNILEQRGFPVDNLRLFGSQRSRGRSYTFRGKEVKVELLSHAPGLFEGVDLAFTSAGAGVSREYAADITRYGALMIDNSSAFRMDDDVPLVVPECNPEDAFHAPRRIIANPNCTTIMLLTAVNPIHKLSPIRHIRVATYQSASGAGAAAMEEVRQQYADISNGREPRVSKFAHQLAYNVIPQVDIFVDNDYTKEEMKMYNEARKIMQSEMKVSATCVRVSTLRCHSEAAWVTTERALTVDEVRAAIASAQGCTLVDDPSHGIYPMPLQCAGNDSVYVGRIRKDIADENTVSLWLTSDQIRKGAALNAIQIGELLLPHLSKMR